MNNYSQQILFALVTVSSFSCLAMDSTKSNRFDELNRKAEEGYQKSSGEKEKEISAAPEVKVEAEQPKQEAPKQSKPFSFWGLFKTERGPILGKHKEFSDEWWDSLLGKCNGCKKSTEKIDCKEILKDNPQWQEVESMSAKSKSLIMKRVLARFYNDNNFDFNHACNFACAVCVGVDPDERMNLEDASFLRYAHTALHVAALKDHYALFALLLAHKANPDLKCTTLYPYQFAKNEQWREELRQAGVKVLNSN